MSVSLNASRPGLNCRFSGLAFYKHYEVKPPTWEEITLNEPNTHLDKNPVWQEAKQVEDKLKKQGINAVAVSIPAEFKHDEREAFVVTAEDATLVNEMFAYRQTVSPFTPNQWETPSDKLKSGLSFTYTFPDVLKRIQALKQQINPETPVEDFVFGHNECTENPLAGLLRHLQAAELKQSMAALKQFSGIEKVKWFNWCQALLQGKDVSGEKPE